MKKKNKHGGGHDNAERWLLTYADVITLLLALFIFLYSISTINVVKLTAFSTSFRELFGMGKIPQSSTSGSGGTSFLPEQNAIVKLQQQLEAEFKDLIEGGMVDIEKTDEGLALRLNDKVVFGIASAEVSVEAESILDNVGKYLTNLPNDIRIEGHTDNLAMSPGSKYPTNWELSGARAASVVRYMIEHDNIEPKRLSLAGYAEYKPVSDNNSDNRRVEIVVLKTLEEKKKERTVLQAQRYEEKPVRIGHQDIAPAGVPQDSFGRALREPELEGEGE